MTFEQGLLLGIFGMLITIVGFMIAYVIAYKTVFKKKKEYDTPDALKDLFKK